MAALERADDALEGLDRRRALADVVVVAALVVGGREV